jgi:hypothetical protein
VQQVFADGSVDHGFLLYVDGTWAGRS